MNPNTWENNIRNDTRIDSPDMRNLQTSRQSQQSWSTITIGLVLGFLIGGLALATIISIWLTSSTQTTTVVSNMFTSTSTTTTTVTTTTTTTATTTTTPLTSCPTSNTTANSYLSPGTPLFSTYTINVACTTYFSVAWLYVVQSPNETISIATYNVPATTYIDDVSIFDINTSQQLLNNGGFESGSAGWSGTAVGDIGSGGASCHTGSWCYSDAAVSPHGGIAQSVTATVGHTLLISFYIAWPGTGVIYNNITITP